MSAHDNLIKKQSVMFLITPFVSLESSLKPVHLFSMTFSRFYRNQKMERFLLTEKFQSNSGFAFYGLLFYTFQDITGNLSHRTEILALLHCCSILEHIKWQLSQLDLQCEADHLPWVTDSHSNPCTCQT